MSEEPEQVLPEESRSAGVGQDLVADHKIRGYEEAGSGDVIENEEDAGGHQDGERGQSHQRGNEPRPGAEWEAHQRHALTSHVESSGDEVQRSQQLAYAENGNRTSPKNYAETFAGAGN